MIYAGRLDFINGELKNWFRYETEEEAKATLIDKEKKYLAKFGSNENTVNFLWNKDTKSMTFMTGKDFAFHKADEMTVTKKELPLYDFRNRTEHQKQDKWIQNQLLLVLLKDPDRKSMSGK